jgi:hypothetical protein
MVSMLVIRLKVHRFKPGQGDKFLRVIKKVCSMPSIGGEVKPEAPCHSLCPFLLLAAR